MTRKFVIVDFIEENRSDLIPQEWLFNMGKNLLSYWPPKGSNVTKLVKKVATPTESWMAVPVKIVKGMDFDNYESARNKIREIEAASNTSDLNSDKDARNKKRKARYFNENYVGHSDGERIPIPPTLPDDVDSARLQQHSPVLSLCGSLDSLQSSAAYHSSSEESNGLRVDIDTGTQKKHKAIEVKNNAQCSLTPHSSKYEARALKYRHRPTSEQRTSKSNSVSSAFSQNVIRTTSASSYSQNSNEKQSVTPTSVSDVTRPCCQHDKNWQDHVNRKLLEITHGQKQMREMLQVLMQGNGGNNQKAGVSNSDVDEDFSIFPIDSYAELKTFDESLEDPAKKKKLISFLAQHGGHSPGDAVRRILRLLVTDKLAAKFTWGGATGKPKFSDWNLIPAVYSAVKRMPNIGDGTSKKQLEDIAKDWLRRAPDRKRIKDKKPAKSVVIPESSEDEV